MIFSGSWALQWFLFVSDLFCEGEALAFFVEVGGSYVFLGAWVLYVVLVVQLGSLACVGNYFFSGLEEFWVVVVGGWKNLDIFVFNSLIKGTYGVTFPRLFQINS